MQTMAQKRIESTLEHSLVERETGNRLKGCAECIKGETPNWAREAVLLRARSLLSSMLLSLHVFLIFNHFGYGKSPMRILVNRPRVAHSHHVPISPDFVPLFNTALSPDSDFVIVSTDNETLFRLHKIQPTMLSD